MFDTDVGVFRNGHVLREHDFIDVADTVSRMEPDGLRGSFP